MTPASSTPKGHDAIVWSGVTVIHMELTEDDARVVQQELESRVHYYYARLKKPLTPGTKAQTERKMQVTRRITNEIRRALE